MEIFRSNAPIFINDALLYPDLKHKLLSFKDVRANGFHVETEIEKGT